MTRISCKRTNELLNKQTNKCISNQRTIQKKRGVRRPQFPAKGWIHFKQANKDIIIAPPSRLVQAALLPTDRDDATEERAQGQGDPNFLQKNEWSIKQTNRYISNQSIIQKTRGVRRPQFPAKGWIHFLNKDMIITPPSRLVQAALLPTHRDDATEAKAQG